IRKEKFGHLRAAAKETKIKGAVCEFGVHAGHSLKVLCEAFPKDIVWGFDSFEGLPEDWNTGTRLREDGIIRKEEFILDISEIVFPKNSKIIKGWFDQSILKWKREYKVKTIKFLHIDSDLYSSAKTILKELNNEIKKDTIIVFDELATFARQEKYPNWKEGEWKALIEWINEYDREFEILMRSGYWNATIRITK
ncbi:MAG TPA: TylF/MycF/NovP-related O-methyltransferase, partial [Thermodesulfobacteriota bacterium]|nr:TylF/MycF/NovP-related O-methyltransferase [Thermodesulfobacteriota bacterium]